MLKAFSLLFLLFTLPAFSEEYQRPLLRAIFNKDYVQAESMILSFNKQGLDLSNQDAYFAETPLTMAVKRGWLRGVRLLLILWANPHIPNEEGFTPLMLATNLGMVDIATELLRYPPPLPLRQL